MASSDSGQALTAAPVKLSKNPSKSGCLTVFVQKVLKKIHDMKDAEMRVSQRNEFIPLIRALQTDRDSKDMPYRRKRADDLQTWLSEAQTHWGKDMTTDLEFLLKQMENDAEKYKQATRAEQALLEQQQVRDDADFVMVDKEAEALEEWELVG